LNEVIRRPADLLARYGGEEFVLLLPETGGEGAVNMARRVQEKMVILNIRHDYSGVAKYITLSLGIATTIPSDDQLKDALIQRADELLYEAKKNGRNQYMDNLKISSIARAIVAK
jgi:two-component system cell cycle response regulator